MPPHVMLRIRYEVDDGIPLVVKRECTPGLGVSGAKLKHLVNQDNLGAEETSFVFSVDSPDGGRRTLRDSDAFALGETGTVICLHLSSRTDGLSVNTAVNGRVARVVCPRARAELGCWRRAALTTIPSGNTAVTQR